MDGELYSSDDEFAFTDHREWSCSAEEYHADEALSSTRLKVYLGIDGGGDSDAAREGTAIHTFALEPEREGSVVRRPNEPQWLVEMRGKKGVVEARERWVAEWEAEHSSPGITVLSPASYERARRRASALSRFELAKGLPLSKVILRRDALVERSARFMVYGLAGKRRIDLEIPQYVTLDLKSTCAPSVDEFRRDVFRRAYDMQAAWNVDSGEPLHGRPKTFGFLAVNEAAEVAWIVLPESQIAMGAERYRSALRLARVHREMQQMPPSHWSFAGHTLPDPAPWERAQVEDVAQYARGVELWHRRRQQSQRETEAAAQ